MGIVQVSSPAASTVLLPREHTSVWVKAAWADAWQECPYLEPLKASDEVQPGLSTASFRYRYGRIKREDRSAIEAFNPLEFKDWFVQVRLVGESGSRPLWTGIITDEAGDIHGDRAGAQASGDQELTAYGLELLLERAAIRRGHVFAFGTTTETIIERMPSFNQKACNGPYLLGNRSTSPGSDGVYRFSTDGAVWTVRQAIESLIKFYGPAGLSIAVDGPAAILDRPIGVVESAANVRATINKLISRRRGAGWHLRPESEGAPFAATLHVFSIYGEPVAVGSTVIPANTERADLLLGSTVEVEECRVELSTASKYDRIVVLGKRPKVTFTVSFTDLNLIESWTAALAAAYKAGTGTPGDSPERHDAERRLDAYRRVYRAYRLPPNWTWQAGDGVGGALQLVAIKVGAGGDVDPTTAGAYWNDDRPLLRQLVIQEASGSADEDPEFLKPMAFIKNPEDNRYYQVDRLSKPEGEDDEQFEGDMPMRMLDTETGFELSPSIGHILARNHFSGAADSDIDPVFDYTTLVATLCIETDEVLRVEAAISADQQSDQGRELVIEVPDAEYWYVVPGTVYGAVNGALVHHAGGAVRDDSGMLEDIAALARAWYGAARAKATVRWKELAIRNPVGSWLGRVGGELYAEEAGSVVTSKHWDFERGTTQISTGWEEFDASGAEDLQDIGDLRALAKMVLRQGGKLQEITQMTNNLPLRQSNSSRVGVLGK